MQRKEYKTKRLVIKPYNINDYEAWFDAYTNKLPAISKFDSGPRTKDQCSKKNYKKMLQTHESWAKTDTIYIWGIFEKKSGELIGALDIAILVRQEIQKANLGYQIFNRHLKKGYAKEAVQKLIKHTLIDLKLNRLEAIIDEDNFPSIALVKSLKLRTEGIRQNYYFQNNDWDNQVVYIADRKMLKLPKLRL